MLRCTRLAGLVNALDPRLVAAAFGVNPEGVMLYLADHVDKGRLPKASSPVTATNQARSNPMSGGKSDAPVFRPAR